MAREGMYSTFDPAPFLAALDGDRACFVEFSQPFLAALRPSVDGVLEAAAGGDGAALHERSHALKGAVSI